MALADSARAIGAVTRLLRDHLIRRGFEVSVGKPEVAATQNTNPKLNLFLYETLFDGSLRNVALDDRTPPPLWLSLRYLLTAFDTDENSDSAGAHELLGRGLSAVHELNFLALDAAVALDVRQALENNPEPLKITFDETNADLLSKVMQGTDERYRLSVGFQVRPVMIVPATTPRLSLLVGVDYMAAPPAIIGGQGVVIDVLPTLGPHLADVRPSRFETGAEFELTGDDLHITGLECVLGGVPLVVVERRPDRLLVRAEGPLSGGAVEGPIAAGTALSAGEHPLVVRRRLSPTRVRSSNMLGAALLPTVTGAAVAAGAIQVTGLLLGTIDDDIIVALYQDGRVARTFDVVTPSADQKTLGVPGAGGTVPAGNYQVIVRVNGQQAKVSPTVAMP